MLSAEERRRLDQIANGIRRSDPRFVARLDRLPHRRRRVVLAVCLTAWAAVVALTAVGGWWAALIAAALLAVAGVVALRQPRRR
jgi:uncharacterized ion transporter superfamily protein YfcC